MNAATTPNAASISSPAIQRTGAGSAAIAWSQIFASSSPLSSASKCSRASAASAGSYAAPARRSITSRASSAPPAERKTEMSRATCSSRAGSGIASPTIPAGSPCPSQRSNTNASASSVPEPKPSQFANRCATSQCSANVAWASGSALASVSATIFSRTSGGRPVPTCSLKKAATSSRLPPSTSANAARGTMSSP